MKICVLGNGLLASEFGRMEYDVYDYKYTDFKVEDISKYDIIINTYDYTLENDGNISDMVECNIEMPLLLSNFCKNNKKRYVHISTAQLYEGRTINDETSRISGSTPYLASKLLGESVCGKKSIIVRLGTLFNSDVNIDNGLYKAVINSTPIKNGESFVWATDAIRSIVKLLKKRRNGIFNIASEGYISQADICNEVGIENIAPTTATNRLDYVKLNVNKLKESFIPMNVMDNISPCFEELKIKLGE